MPEKGKIMHSEGARGQCDTRLGDTDARSEQPDPQTGAALQSEARPANARRRRAPQPERCDKEKREKRIIIETYRIPSDANTSLTSPESGLQPEQGDQMKLKIVERTADQRRVVEIVDEENVTSGEQREEQLARKIASETREEESETRAKIASAARGGGTEQSCK
ncbi:hypothetical protein R3P38DRAFT_2792554 [Favolaschia claudopus]|uniref:Uncharacterized protein n=1 Tax=Favolaschia claudopus TaxID=2862362 RepID=A0AAW0AGE0_9AGAR